MSKFAIAALLIITFCTINVLTAAQPASAQSDVATPGSKSAIVARPASGSLGHDNAEKLCERNARTQITYWGPDDAKTELHEYAHKEWSDYYGFLSAAMGDVRRGLAGIHERETVSGARLLRILEEVDGGV